MTFEDEKLIGWMSRIEPSFGTIHDREDIAGIIGLGAKDLDVEIYCSKGPFT